jgi:ABC-type sugar transport system permease subunit
MGGDSRCAAARRGFVTAPLTAAAAMLSTSRREYRRFIISTDDAWMDPIRRSARHATTRLDGPATRLLGSREPAMATVDSVFARIESSAVARSRAIWRSPRWSRCWPFSPPIPWRCWYGSLHTTPPGEAGTFSLDGYRAMLSRANALVLLNTIGLSLVKTGLSMALALFLAWIVARTDTPYRESLEVMITLPFYIPPILTAMAWGMLATPKGGLLNLAWTGLTGQREPLINIYSYGASASGPCGL